MRRVLIIGTDGLRPDSVDPELMPTYAQLIKKGTLFTQFYAVYPPHTRVSMTTLTTGVYPGRHGVVSNLMFIPGFHEDGLLQTGNDKHLLEYKQEKREPFIFCPTLGDRLHAHGKRLAVAASSSPGASLLWNLNHPELVVNPASDYGEAVLTALHQKLGEVPAQQSRVRREQALWATQAMIDVHLPNPDNQVMVLWLSEPDAAQHDYGLGSPQAREALQAVDHCVALILEAVEHLGIRDQLDIFLISDHGHSTVDACGSLEDHVNKACSELALSTKFIVIGNNIYASPDQEPNREDIARLADWLQRQEWYGMMLAGRTDLADLPGVLPAESVIGPVLHDRMPLLSVCPRWSEEANEYGVPGTGKTLINASGLKSNHGTLSPYDLHAFCLGYGPGFKEGMESDIPCGIIDISPTVCHMIGLTEESGFDGRVLFEGLQQDEGAE